MEEKVIVNVFDGISCGRVALDRLNIPVKYYASEIDKKAIEISQKNYPDIIQLGDITTIKSSMHSDGQILYSFKVDLIMGGSPCQSFSNAGNRTGFDGKSGLFWEYARLVKELKPKYFILENVKMKQEWQGIFFRSEK